MEVRVDASLAVLSLLLLEEGAMVETWPSAKVVVKGRSDRVTVTTSPFGRVARKMPPPRNA